MIGHKYQWHKQPHQTPPHGIHNIQQKVNFSSNSFIPSHCEEKSLLDTSFIGICMHIYIYTSLYSFIYSFPFLMVIRWLEGWFIIFVAVALHLHIFLHSLARFLCNTERHLTIDFRCVFSFFSLLTFRWYAYLYTSIKSNQMTPLCFNIKSQLSLIYQATFVWIWSHHFSRSINTRRCMIESQFVTQLEICLLFFNRFLTASTHLMAPAVGKKLHVSSLQFLFIKQKGVTRRSIVVQLILCFSRLSFRSCSYANKEEKILYSPLSRSRSVMIRINLMRKNNGWR